MQTALRVTTRVLPGHRVEIVAPDMPTLAQSAKPTTTLTEFLDSLPSGPRSAATWEEIEQNLQEGRNSWNRDC